MGGDEAGRSWRVCLAGRSPFLGGAEVAAERLARGLRAAGAEPWWLVGCEGVVADRARAAGYEVEVVSVDPVGRSAWWTHRRRVGAIASAIERRGADVVHINDLPTARMVARAARRVGKPVVVHHRFTYPGAGIDWFNAAGADRHVYVSATLRAELEGASARLAGQAGETIHDALEVGGDEGAGRFAASDRSLRSQSAWGDLSEEPGDRVAAKRAVGLEGDRLVVLFSGQVIERKGVETLLRAWAQMSEAARSSARLVVVGDDLSGGGAYRQRMEGVALALGIDAVFVGFVEDVEPWRRAADVAVVPSRAEPLGLVVLEAMRSGVAVIGSRVGGIPEMIEDGVSGLLCQADDAGAWSSAMAGLIGSAERRAVLAAGGRRRVAEAFSIERQVERVLGVYERVAGETGRSTARRAA